jgi:hypothetical protein
MHTLYVRLVGITGSNVGRVALPIIPTHAHVVHAFANNRLVSRVRLTIPLQEPLCGLTSVSVARGLPFHTQVYLPCTLGATQSVCVARYLRRLTMAKGKQGGEGGRAATPPGPALMYPVHRNPCFFYCSPFVLRHAVS